MINTRNPSVYTVFGNSNVISKISRRMLNAMAKTNRWNVSRFSDRPARNRHRIGVIQQGRGRRNIRYVFTNINKHWSSTKSLKNPTRTNSVTN